MSETLEILIGGALLLMIPTLLAAVGEIISERAGILNIGIEGVMLTGAFATAGALQLGGSVTISVLAALPVGLIVGLILSLLFIRRDVNQIVGGILFNLFALGATTMIFATYFDTGIQGGAYEKVQVPLVAGIPIAGPALFSQPVLVYVSLALVLVAQYVLMRTWFGLHVRAAGERPEALDTAGVSVGGIRTTALAIGCVMVALGGASLVALQAGTFTPGMTEGRGFIALGIAMVARWKPLLALPAAGIFGLAEVFQFHAQALGLTAVPPQFWAMLPYIVAIVAVSIGRAARYPAAIAVPYVRE